jgi:hypothetical protein
VAVSGRWRWENSHCVVSEGGLEPLRVDLPDIGSVPALLWVPPVATAWGEIDFQSRTSPTLNPM